MRDAVCLAKLSGQTRNMAILVALFGVFFAISAQDTFGPQSSMAQILQSKIENNDNSNYGYDNSFVGERRNNDDSVVAQRLNNDNSVVGERRNNDNSANGRDGETEYSASGDDSKNTDNSESGDNDNHNDNKNPQFHSVEDDVPEKKEEEEKYSAENLHRNRHRRSLSGEGRRRRNRHGLRAVRLEGGGGGVEGGETASLYRSHRSGSVDLDSTSGAASGNPVGEAESLPSPSSTSRSGEEGEEGEEEDNKGKKKSCASCRIREDAKQLRLELIKAQILQKLRLTHVPNITKTDVASRLPTPIEHLISQYGDGGGGGGGRQRSAGGRRFPGEEEEEDDGEDDFHATTTKVIKFGEKREI